MKRRFSGLRDLCVEPAASGVTSELVVLMHGAFGGPSRMDDIAAEVRRLRPDAALLRPRYGGLWVFSRDDVFELASALEVAIAEADAAENYRRITLIGHSAGALLLRKAYVYGRGSTEDRTAWPRCSPPRPWTTKVRRIVLLAGMNRGWSVGRRSPRVPRWRYVLFRLGNAAARALGIGSWLTHFGRLARSVEFGAPFVANLRIQWTHISRGPGADPPPVVQLLGDIDRLVSNADNADLETSDFVLMPVRGADHSSLIRWSGGRTGPEEAAERRRAKFEEALETPIDELREAYWQTCDETVVTAATDVVFLLHGIRDYGQWTAELRAAIRERDERFAVVTPRYRYFPMLLFLLLSERQKNVRWFMDEYTEQLAANWLRGEPAPRFHFVGHSNGTYILASALSRYATVRFHRVALAGSVLPRGYPWDELVRTGRVEAIRNDLADRDLVVGIFPRMFELARVADLGSGGFHGFWNDAGNRQESIHAGGHSAAIKRKWRDTNPERVPNLDHMAEFVVTGTARLVSGRLRGWALWASKFAPLVWAGIVLVVGVLTAVMAAFAGFWAAAGLLTVVVLLLLIV